MRFLRRHSAYSYQQSLLSTAMTGAMLVGGTLATALTTSCNEHVFVIFEPQCTRQIDEELNVPLDKPADILVVVDSSGSMCEEQENLVQNFFVEGCPITDLANVPEQFKNPTPEQVEQLAQQCGFIQILAAFDNDFRIGVITTDTGFCDNRFGQAAGGTCGVFSDPDWGRRPQRGCLQAPPGAASKVIQKGDNDIGERFRATLDNIRTFGSGFERAFDATEIFLDPNSVRAEGCENDLEEFIRDDAKLVVIYLTDEEDCSHGDNAFGFGDENDLLDEIPGIGNCDEAFEDLPSVDSLSCYNKPELLVPVDHYVDFLKSYKGEGREQDVSVAVIAGGVRNAQGGIEAGGCSIDARNGEPDAQCSPAFGSSNDPTLCDPAQRAAQGLPPCCAADSGTRYFQLASGMGAGQALADSICFASFRNTMIDIARFIARIEFVQLAEAPADPNAIVVRIQRAGEVTAQVVPRISQNQNPDGQDGWQLDGDRTIRFYGNFVPQPGDDVDVAALAKRNTTVPCGELEPATDAGAESVE